MTDYILRGILLTVKKICDKKCVKNKEGIAMTKMTSAYANKLLRKLNDDKTYWLEMESDGSLYVAAVDEEPVVPDYNYSEVTNNISQIDEKILKIKHAINLSNCTNQIEVEGRKYTIDQTLVKMAQLNKRKNILDRLRKQSPKTRINSGIYGSRSAVTEYQYINYDLELIKSDYEKVESEVAAMQIALDKYNQTVEFEVDI